MSCVELRKRLGVFSTFIVKSNHQMYPKAALHKVLTARHGRRPAGHWVVMTAMIAGVKVIAVAYAWSQKGVSYFISTCGNMETCDIMYESKYEDDYGQVCIKEIPRPNMLHFYYEYAPLIDEHNKQRQSILGLERHWLMKNCWFRLITTLVGQSVVDMHRLYRHHEIKRRHKPQEVVDQIRVVKFTDLICGGLKLWEYKHNRRGDGTAQLVRITDANGKTVRKLTKTQEKKGRTSNSMTMNCFICRRCLHPEGDKVYYMTTSWWCKDCHMPLCSTNARVGDQGGRERTCLEEHLAADDPFFMCGEVRERGQTVSKDKYINLHPRRSKRKRNDRDDDDGII